MSTLPTYVGASTPVVGTGNIAARIDPSGAVPGDLIILAIQSANQAVTAIGGGWTECPDSPQGAGTAGAANSTRLTLFWKFADKDMLGASNSITVLDTGDHTLAISYAFHGVARVNPFDVTSGGNEANLDTTLSATGDTTTVDNCLVAAIIANSIDGQSTERLSSATNADLGSVTLRTGIQVANGTGGGISLITGTKATAGAFGATTATAANNSNYGFVTLALAPAKGPFLQAIGSLTTGTGNISPAWPTHLTDDVGIAFVETRETEPTVNTPAGWTKFTNTPWATAVGGGARGTQITCFWKRAASGAESAPTFNDAGNHTTAVIITFRNVQTGVDPIDAPTGSVKSSGSTSASIAGTTTGYDNALVIYAATRDFNSTTNQYSAWANANLSGPAEFYDQGSSVDGGGYGLFMGVLGTAGATGTTTATLANSAVEAYQVFGVIGTGSIIASKARSWGFVIG